MLWLLAVLLVLAGLTFGTLIDARHTEKTFALLQPGDGEQQVLRKMGKPKERTACGTIPAAKAGCAQEWLYAHPLAPVVPEYWIVRIDRDGRVQQTIQSTVRSSY